MYYIPQLLITHIFCVLYPLIIVASYQLLLPGRITALQDLYFYLALVFQYNALTIVINMTLIYYQRLEEKAYFLQRFSFEVDTF